MKKISVAYLVTVLLLTSCGSSKQISIVNAWMNKEKLKDRPVKKVYIMCMFKNSDMVEALEHALEEEATARNYTTYGNSYSFPYKVDDPELAKTLVLQKVKSLECDAIFVTTVKRVHSETHYVSTSSVGVGVGGGYYPYNNGYHPYTGYQGNFNSYYSGYYSEASLSGYYATDKSYFIESNLFDTNTLELLWSVQSKSYNPTDAQKVSKEYCNELFKLLEKEPEFRGRREK
jgi:hypothetical protein